MRKYGMAIWNLQLLLVSTGSTKQEASDMGAELIAEINTVDNVAVAQFSMGNIQPLFDCINASVLVWMDDSKKASLIAELS